MDARINQDLKILQQLVSKPPSGGAVVNVINIGRVHVGSNQEIPDSLFDGEETVESVGMIKGGEITEGVVKLLKDGVENEKQDEDIHSLHPRTSLPRLRYRKKFEIEEKFYHNLQFVLENLPEPRYDSLVRMMFEIAKEKFEKAVEAAAWVGVSTDTFYGHMRKYGIPKFKQVKRNE